jgi:hypothetical protein
MRNDITRMSINRSKDHLDGVGRFPSGLFTISGSKV